MQNFTPYQYLAFFARLAIERLDSDSDLRTDDRLDELLDAYARTYGETCDTSIDECYAYLAKPFIDCLS